MKSKASIASHPLHPAIVPVPIGAFALALIGDVVHAMTQDPFWYRFAFIALGIGIVTALVAALFGLLDFFKVHMSEQGARIARTHMILNLCAVTLYIVNFALRRDGGALGNGRWRIVFPLEVITFVGLGVSGWLGGTLAFKHKVGVVERLDPEATAIGMSERS